MVREGRREKRKSEKAEKAKGEKRLVSLSLSPLACEQALSGALAKGREKEGELATTSLEFEHLHRKSPYEMLLGGDDIANDVICLGLAHYLEGDVKEPVTLFELKE